MKAEFNNSNGWAAIGIVRDTYNIPENVHPNDYPHCNHMVSYGMDSFGMWYGKVHYQGHGTSGNISYKNNQIVKLEFDSEKGTLIFFVDGVQQPVYVAGINENVRFFISLQFAQSSCTIRSLKRLRESSTTNVPNEKAVQWQS
ncbi:MAG: hypothetical protein EZS28_027379 [Streblomastix strix]|uniref:B30.2/SPRY domain-containing protein n=1 Tax=Streblomastix strix TaxID=222440 RepID=A0A5J4V4T6_9EUKA|nr:MAG: hypothetical protein EZS28_027379 [Streblomastix strix]